MKTGNYATDDLDSSATSPVFSLRVDVRVLGWPSTPAAPAVKGATGVSRQLRRVLAVTTLVPLRFVSRVFVFVPLCLVCCALMATLIAEQAWKRAGELVERRG